MRRVVVVRCPKCGSTDAGEDPLDPGAYEFTRMKCNTCGWNELADHYMIKDDWNVDIDLEEDAELPKLVPV